MTAKKHIFLNVQRVTTRSLIEQLLLFGTHEQEFTKIYSLIYFPHCMDSCNNLPNYFLVGSYYFFVSFPQRAKPAFFLPLSLPPSGQWQGTVFQFPACNPTSTCTLHTGDGPMTFTQASLCLHTKLSKFKGPLSSFSPRM